MSTLLRRHQRADLSSMLAALDEALTLMDGRGDASALAQGRAVVGRAGERLRLSADHTVVALAGATGSGKSSLFNALAGEALSPIGVRRPTTSRAHAHVWGEEGSAPLLQWLGVPPGHVTVSSSDLSVANAAAATSELNGLLLLDLPDHDSTAEEHRLEVDRLVDLVDLLVWVVDPQKYADAALHERYLRRLAGHEGVMVVVLNQVDRLTPGAATSCAADLRRLLDEDGLHKSPVLSCSAATGAGLDALRDLLRETVRKRRARNDRLVADVDAVVAELSQGVGTSDGKGIGARERAELIEALAGAAGVPVIGAAVQRSWQHRSAGAVGWPPVRWLRRLRPDPLRRLHLRPDVHRDVRSMVRSSVPEASPVQRAQVDTAVRHIRDAAGNGLPRAWQAAVRRATDAASGDLGDQLDAAVVATDLGVDRTPLWWRVVGFVQWLLVAALLTGLGWLALLAFGSYLRLPEPPTPEVRGFAVPSLLVLGGIALGVSLAFLGRILARIGGRARRRRAESRLRAAIAEVAERLLLGPVVAELTRHAKARAALARARDT